METRTEYRVVYDDRTEQSWEVPLADETSLDEARRRMAFSEKAARRRGRFNHRIEESTVTRSDWSEVADA